MSRSGQSRGGAAGDAYLVLRAAVRHAARRQTCQAMPAVVRIELASRSNDSERKYTRRVLLDVSPLTDKKCRTARGGFSEEGWISLHTPSTPLTDGYSLGIAPGNTPPMHGGTSVAERRATFAFVC